MKIACRFHILLSAVALLAAAAPVAAQEPPSEPRWSLARLNPFKSQDDRPSGALADSPPNSGWKFPSFPRPKLPQPQLPSLSRSEGDDSPSRMMQRENAAAESGASGFQPLKRINNGARGFFSTARNTITKPFTRRSRAETKPPTAAPSRSFLPFGGGKSDPPPVENANDWLKLPRPRPGG